jgi:hypothetical protein
VLHVRDQPTTRGNEHATTLKKGDPVYVMGQVDTWYLIDHAGGRGYAAKAYIELT